MTAAQQLEADFDRELLGLCDECVRVFGKRPARFQEMVWQRGSVGAAKTLLQPDSAHQSVAYGELTGYDQTNFHLTLEYVVVQNRYRSLFTQAELNEAESRLAWFPTRTVNRNFY